MSETLPATAPDPAGELAVPEPMGAPEGLEDFDQNDLVMPMLRIKHDDGVIEDNLSGQTYEKMSVIMLGLIKQRVLWDAEVKEDSHPLCKSYDFTVGHPDVKEFPWKESGFTRIEDENATLPCADCQLKEWGSHPQREAPWCSEQHTFALLMPVGDDGWSPALFTVQRSAIKASKTYLTSFARAKKPLYTVTTNLSLEVRKRGTVTFAVPRFVQGEATDQADWPDYASQYRFIREFVQTPRSRDEEGEPSEGAPPAGSAAAPAAAASTAAPAASGGSAPVDDDDLPF